MTESRESLFPANLGYFEFVRSLPLTAPLELGEDKIILSRPEVELREETVNEGGLVVYV
jgi:hypothetical protein